MTTVVVCVLMALLLWWALSPSKPRSEYDWSDSNPYRCRCTKCGQRWEAYCWAGDQHVHERQWWEPNGETPNPDCDCHKEHAK